MKSATEFGYKVGEYFGQQVTDSKQGLLTDDNLNKAERDYLLSLGLTESEFEIKKITVDRKQNLKLNTFIVHTDKGRSDSGKPSIVLIHGYGGTGLAFDELILVLATNFRVILIDLIGNGSSSRPKWDIENGLDADICYSVMLENWRRAMDLTDFYLVGTSYGGYIAGNYAASYPRHIRKLVLCGPVGLAQKPPNFSRVARHDMFDKMPLFVRMVKD